MHTGACWGALPWQGAGSQTGKASIPAPISTPDLWCLSPREGLRGGQQDSVVTGQAEQLRRETQCPLGLG